MIITRLFTIICLIFIGVAIPDNDCLHYKNHISIEFNHGVELADPDGLLEGKGKHRRHVKIVDKQDIEAKNVAAFIAEAVKI